MNEPDARAIPAPGGGYYGQFRLCWRADYVTVSRWNAEKAALLPLNFKNALAAELSAWRAKSKVEYPVMRRDGAVIEARSAADALFNLPSGKDHGNED